jgi:hypothetical protein
MRKSFVHQSFSMRDHAPGAAQLMQLCKNTDQSAAHAPAIQRAHHDWFRSNSPSHGDGHFRALVSLIRLFTLISSISALRITLKWLSHDEFAKRVISARRSSRANAWPKHKCVIRMIPNPLLTSISGFRPKRVEIEIYHSLLLFAHFHINTGSYFNVLDCLMPLISMIWTA